MLVEEPNLKKCIIKVVVNTEYPMHEIKTCKVLSLAINFKNPKPKSNHILI